MNEKEDTPLTPVGSGNGEGRSRASRLDREIERLRTSPTPTANQSLETSINSFVSGVPWMGIFPVPATSSPPTSTSCSTTQTIRRR